MTTAKFTTVEDFRNYALGGKATFTVVSLKTGNRDTFQMVEGEKGWLVRGLIGSDNTDSYAYIGLIYKYQNTHLFKIAQKNNGRAISWSMKKCGLRWLTKQLNADHLHPQVEIWHSGHCSRCNRLLTTPESIARGLGPVCATRVNL